MNSKTHTTTSLIPERELRSKPRYDILFQLENPAQSIGNLHVHGRSKSTTATANPILRRKNSKSSSRKSSFIKNTSNSLKTKRSRPLSQVDDQNQLDEMDYIMEYEITEQKRASNLDGNDSTTHSPSRLFFNTRVAVTRSDHSVAQLRVAVSQ